MVNKRIILATGDDSLDGWLTDFLLPIGKVVKKIDVRSHIVPQWQEIKADLIVISDQLPSEIPASSQEERDQEWVEVVEQMRLQSDTIRIVFLCRREVGDQLLAKLLELNVLDIFWEGHLIPEELMRLLQQPPTYKRVAHLKKTSAMKGSNRTKIRSHGISLSAESKKAQGNIAQLPEQTAPKYISLSKLVVIGSLAPCSGSTFLTAHLARYLGEKHLPVAVLEPVNNNPVWFDYLLSRHKEPKHWEPWSLQIQRDGKVERETEWKEHGVVWIPVGEQPLLREWSTEDSLMLINHAKRYPIVLADVSYHWHESMTRLLTAQADMVWVVMDSDPVKLGRSLKNPEFIHNCADEKWELIANRWPVEVAKPSTFINSWFKKINVSKSVDCLTLIPDFGRDAIKAMWEGKMIWDYREHQGSLEKALYPLAAKIVPEEVRQTCFKTKKSGAFSFIRFWEGIN